jgi:hypothetical protein
MGSALLLVFLALLSACAPVTVGNGVTSANVPSPAPSSGAPIQVSQAKTPQAYRQDAAAHLYKQNQSRIYQGLLPAFLYAVAVTQVQLDARGQVVAIHWLRAPAHAPEVVKDIERTLRQAAPFPAPVNMGHAEYIETWLWDASGRFQLHSLTEGQSWDVAIQQAR